MECDTIQMVVHSSSSCGKNIGSQDCCPMSKGNYSKHVTKDIKTTTTKKAQQKVFPASDICWCLSYKARERNCLLWANLASPTAPTYHHLKKGENFLWKLSLKTMKIFIKDDWVYLIPYWVSTKGTFHLRFCGIRPLRGWGGTPPFR